MASILEVGSKWRALVRKRGETHCATFPTAKLAKEWASRMEREIEEKKAIGLMAPRDLTVPKLIERYERELYPLKPWGRSKTADLRVLRAAFEEVYVRDLTSVKITEAFTTMSAGGTGGVGLGSRAGYLCAVLATARELWHIDAPHAAAEAVRKSLTRHGLISVSKERDRRVTDGEIEQLTTHLEQMATKLPMRDLIDFSVVTALRVSEVCALRWADLTPGPLPMIWVRNRKHPKKKAGNDMQIPLLKVGGRDAYEILKRQPRIGPLVFPYNCRTVSKYVVDAALFLELPDLHHHDLRHEGISRMFEAGYSIPQVALVSGHRDWGMLRRYTNLRPADLHKSPANA
jgi:integrase